MNRRDLQRPIHLSGALLLAGIVAMSGTFAVAAAEPMDNQSGVHSGRGPFSIHDLNRDGLLSREEYQQFLARITRRRQTDEQSGRHFPLPLSFEEIDTNKDGYLTEDEMVSALNRRLDRQKRYRRRGKRWE